MWGALKIYIYMSGRTCRLAPFLIPSMIMHFRNWWNACGVSKFLRKLARLPLDWHVHVGLFRGCLERDERGISCEVCYKWPNPPRVTTRSAQADHSHILPMPFSMLQRNVSSQKSRKLGTGSSIDQQMVRNTNGAKHDVSRHQSSKPQLIKC